MLSRLLVFWAYAAELVLSSTVLFLVVVAFGIDRVAYFMQVSAPDFAAYFGATMFAASLALFWTFYSKADSDFMQWLQERGAFSVYLRAFHVTIAIYLVMLLAVAAAKHTGSTVIAIAAAWISFLGIINAYSIVKNVSDLMRLNVLFNQKKNHP